MKMENKYVDVTKNYIAFVGRGDIETRELIPKRPLTVNLKDAQPIIELDGMKQMILTINTSKGAIEVEQDHSINTINQSPEELVDYHKHLREKYKRLIDDNHKITKFEVYIKKTKAG